MKDGIIVVRKEEGYTSHDVVACLRGILHIKKIGHTGTLDPMASGVLPVAVGKGTSLAELLTEKKKTYETVMHLGTVTDTQDITGTVLMERPVNVTEEEILAAAESFVGDRMQIPPMYSALKVNGKKLYELAREGKTVERAPRPVTFFEIQVTDINLPFVSMTVMCSKGTYIRTLCNDLGEALGCGGCMESLVRTASGDFFLTEAHTLDEIRGFVQAGTIDQFIIAPEELFDGYMPCRTIPDADILLKNGNPIPDHLVTTVRAPEPEERIRLYLSDGTFAGFYVYDKQKNRFKAFKMFL